MNKTIKIALLIGLGLIITITAQAKKTFAMINRGSKTRRSIKIGNNTFYTNYHFLPLFPNVWTTISIADTIKAIKGLNLPENSAKNIFALIVSESAKDRKTGNFRGLNNNYAGVQTDSGVWGFANFSGQTAKVDSGKQPRMFAQFDDFQSFIQFIANRLQSKGFFDAKNANEWASTYITKWWGQSITPEKIKNKAAIYNTAIKIWEKN